MNKTLIWGGGDELERLEKDADRIGSKNVCFKGRVDKKQIPAILAGGDALFLDPFDEAVSRYGISSNKLFEYFAAGKPILMCSLPGHNPAERFHCSITYENTPEGVAAAIRKAFSLREDEREEMRRGALAAAEEYSFDTLSAKLDSVLVTDMGTFGTPSTVAFCSGRHQDIIQFYSNYTVRSTERLTDGVRNGHVIFYFPNGNPQVEADFVDGLEEGPYIVYRQTGIPFYQGSYHAGQRVGVWEFYDEEGNLVNTIDYSKSDPQKNK